MYNMYVDTVGLYYQVYIYTLYIHKHKCHQNSPWIFLVLNFSLFQNSIADELPIENPSPLSKGVATNSGSGSVGVTETGWGLDAVLEGSFLWGPLPRKAERSVLLDLVIFWRPDVRRIRRGERCGRRGWWFIEQGWMLRKCLVKN